MTKTLHVTAAQMLAAKLAVELIEQAGELPDEALKAIANAQVVTDEQSVADTQRADAAAALDGPEEAAQYTSDDALADVLLEQGFSVEGMQEQADGGDVAALVSLAMLLGKRGDVEGLRQRAETGDVFAATRLAYLLAERGDVEGLRQRAETGDKAAANLLADVLADRDDADSLRQRATRQLGQLGRLLTRHRR